MEKFWIIEVQEGVWNSGRTSEHTMLIEHARRFKSKELADMQLSKIIYELGYSDARAVLASENQDGLVELF